MVNVKAWLLPRLVHDAGILGVLGSPGKLVYGAPTTPPALPFLAYRESGNRDSHFSIEGVWGVESTFSFALYDRVSTSALEEALDRAMRGMGFYRMLGRDVPNGHGEWVQRSVGYRRVLSDREVA